MGTAFLIIGIVVFIAAVAGVFEVFLGIRKKNNKTLWIGVALVAPLVVMTAINLAAVTIFAGFR